MASQVEIVNRALTKLGAARITSMGDANKSARTMSALWDTVRRSELRKRNWSFAMRRSSLASLSTAPNWGFALAYQLPSDFLRLVQVSDLYIIPGLTDYREGDDSAYAIEGSQLLTDFPAPLKLRYVADVTDPGAFDALFVEVMASKLAYEGCYDIMQSNQGREAAAQDYKAAVAEGVRTNAIEKPPQGFPDDSWVMGRL